MKDKYLTRDDLVKLDKEFAIVPLTSDCMFKAMFTYDLDILKEFLILETGLDLNPNETEITLLSNELPKRNFKEYKKTIDIYVSLNDKININIELNNSDFNDYLIVRNELYVSKLFTLMFKSGDKPIDFLNKKLIQLNLNTENISLNYGEDIILPYGIKTGKIYPQNKETILKYLAYYKNLYYNLDGKLKKADLWLVAILSENLVELYDLLETLLTNEKRDKFIRKVIEMSKNKFILSEYEKEQLDELKEIARLKNAEDKGIQEGIREGIEQGIEQGIQEGVLKNQKEIVLNMYKEKIELDIISKVTKLTLKEIDEIINNN